MNDETKRLEDELVEQVLAKQEAENPFGINRFPRELRARMAREAVRLYAGVVNEAANEAEKRGNPYTRPGRLKDENGVTIDVDHWLVATLVRLAVGRERDAVIAWLRGPLSGAEAERIADAVERGEHRRST